MSLLDLRWTLAEGVNKNGEQLDDLVVSEARLVLVRQMMIEAEQEARDAANFDNLTSEEQQPFI
jgi:hypothetical protein